MSRTTIAIRQETRLRIKAHAAAEATTIDSFLSRLLDEHDRRRFWSSFEGLTPSAYAASVEADGDSLDEDYRIENRALADDEFELSDVEA